MNVTLKSLGPRKSCERQQESDGAASKGFATGLSDHVRSQLIDNFDSRASNKLACIEVDPVKIQDSIDLTSSTIFDEHGPKRDKISLIPPRKSPNIRIKSNRSSQNDLHLMSIQSCSSKAALDSNYLSDRRGQVLKQYVSNSHSKGLEKSLNSNQLRHTTIEALHRRESSSQRNKFRVHKTDITPLKSTPTSKGSEIRRVGSEIFSAAVSPSRAAISPRSINFGRLSNPKSTRSNRSIQNPKTLFQKKRQPLSKKSYGAFEIIDPLKKQQ